MTKIDSINWTNVLSNISLIFIVLVTALTHPDVSKDVDPPPPSSPSKKSEIRNSKPIKSNVADTKGDGQCQKKWYRRHPNVMEGRMEC